MTYQPALNNGACYLNGRTKNMIKQFFSYYVPYKKLFYVDFFCAVAAGLLELAFPLAVNYFIDTLLPEGDWSVIAAVSVGLLVVYLLTAGLHYVVTYWGHMLGINIETDMRRKLFAHVQKLSFRFFDNTKTGHLIARMTNDLMEIGEMAHHGPEDLFIAIMTLTGAFGIMLFLNWKLAVLTFLIVPAVLWVAVHFNKKMTGAIHRLFGNIADFNARIEDSVGGIRVVQAFSNEDHEQRQFEKDNRRFRLTKLESYKLIAQNMAASYVLMRLVTLFLLVCGTYFVMQGELSYGEFVGFILLSNIFFRPIEKINAIIESYPKGIAGFKRYVELLETEPDVKDTPGAVDVGEVVGNIEYRDVTFSYEGNKPILNRVSFSVAAGETVAFVGPSGAGKTTLCSLLPRFYDADEGTIFIDGMDVKRMTLASLRQQIGIVQQDVFLFSGTIRDNILYGDLGANDEQVMEAVRKARLESVVESLPDGLDTVIGERGVKLSGGQKQRLAIARIFLKNPPILILDEATSALDTETERAIQLALMELSKGRTTLVIAHRLATIQHADRIFVVTPDGIAEQGTHAELLSSEGHYRRLHEAQFGPL